jgi:HK97 family phage prohead protease
MPLLRDLTDDEKALLAPLRGAVRVDRQHITDDIEVRSDPISDSADFYGHASVTGRGYEMYGGPDKGGWTEYVDSGAFKKTLSEKPDTSFLANHGGLTMARTTSGTLKLAEDKIGLETKAKLDTRRGDVRDVVLGMEAGDLNEMSFAFRVVKQQWLNIDGEEVPWWDLTGIDRHLTEVNINKGDVSVVNYGANPFTDAKLRALLDTQELLREAALNDRAPVTDQIDPSYVEMGYRLMEHSMFRLPVL